MSDETDIVLFDGVCALCSASVDFVLKRDRGRRFRFAALQSEVGERLAREHCVEGGLGSVVLIEEGKAYLGSTAALRIARRLRFPWNWSYGLIAVPKPIRDGVYRWIAGNRYRWFGKRESCRVPTEEERERFLD